MRLKRSWNALINWQVCVCVAWEKLDHFYQIRVFVSSSIIIIIPRDIVRSWWLTCGVYLSKYLHRVQWHKSVCIYTTSLLCSIRHSGGSIFYLRPYIYWRYSYLWKSFWTNPKDSGERFCQILSERLRWRSLLHSLWSYVSLADGLVGASAPGVNKKPQKFIFEYWVFYQKSYLKTSIFAYLIFNICIPKIRYPHP